MFVFDGAKLSNSYCPMLNSKLRLFNSLVFIGGGGRKLSKLFLTLAKKYELVTLTHSSPYISFNKEFSKKNVRTYSCKNSIFRKGYRYKV